LESDSFGQHQFLAKAERRARPDADGNFRIRSRGYSRAKAWLLQRASHPQLVARTIWIEAEAAAL
jgi:hypothetical protein